MAANERYNDLTERQRRFAEIYVDIGNGTQAAIQAGYAENTAGTEQWRLRKNAKIRECIEDLKREKREQTQTLLASYAQKAAEEAWKLAMSAESESVRATLLKDLMDRGGYKPTDKIENRTDFNGQLQFGFVDPNETDN